VALRIWDRRRQEQRVNRDSTVKLEKMVTVKFELTLLSFRSLLGSAVRGRARLALDTGSCWLQSAKA
jgi:hypothetical protein